MRLLVNVLCVFLCAAMMAAPFTHLHAHVGHDQLATEIHSDHEHHFDHVPSGSVEDHGQVVYLSNGVSQLDAGDTSMVPWLPLLYVVAVLLMVEPLLRRVPGPRHRVVRAPSQYPPWPPPLRGPPASI
jgi:hypothetical protein